MRQQSPPQSSQPNQMLLALQALFTCSSLLYFAMFSEEFEQPKSFALIAFACFALFWIDWKRVLSDRFAQALLAFTLSAAASCLLSVDWHVSLFGNVKCMNGLLNIASYLVLFGALVTIGTRKAERTLIDTSLACGLFVAAYGIVQTLGFDFQQWNGALSADGFTRPLSFLGHPNFMAGYLAMVLPFGIARIRVAPVRYSLLSASFIACILFSQSRGMLLAAGVGVWVFFLRSKRKTKRLGRAFLLAVALSCAALTVSPEFRATLSKRYRHMFLPGIARLEYPAAAIRIWKRYPWFGIGTDAFETGFQHVRSELYWKVEPNGSPHKAHNDLLNTLATQGIVGFLCALLFSWVALQRALVSRSIYAPQACAAIAAFYVEGLTSFAIVSTTCLFVFCVWLLGLTNENKA